MSLGFPCAVNNQLRTGADKGNPTAYLKQMFVMVSKGAGTMEFLPNALNAKVMQFK